MHQVGKCRIAELNPITTERDESSSKTTFSTDSLDSTAAVYGVIVGIRSLMSRTKIPNNARNELRHRLDEIGGSSPEDISCHRERVEVLNAAYPHNIKYIGDGGGNRSDCMVYALEIPFGLINIVNTFQSITDEFVVALPRLLEQSADTDVFEGRVILYFKEGKTTHVGRIVGSRIISKWGKNPIYEHEIFEVPASYGDEYELFEQPSVGYITKGFVEFVRRHPRYVDIRDGFEEFVVECGI